MADWIARLGLGLPGGVVLGREAERATLASALDDAARGEAVLVDVVGPTGIGKTALVDTLRPVLTARGAIVGMGRIDVGGRSRPFQAIGSAIEEVATQLLAGSSKRLERVRELCASRLSSVGGSLRVLAPSTEYILAAQGDGERAPASPSVTAARQRVVFTGLVRVVAEVVGPLVLFIDDAHRADGDSLELIRHLLAEERDLPLLVVLARHGADSSEALVELLDTCRPVRIRLDGVSPSVVEQLVGAILEPAPTELPELARLLHQRSGGNPFAVRSLLHGLASDGALRFAPDLGRWTVDLAATASTPTTADAAEVVAQQVDALPTEVRELLVLAACVGSGFSTVELATFQATPEADVRRLLQVAAARGAIVPHDPRGLRWSFPHDHILRAVLDLESPGRLVELHLVVGRMLLEELPSSPSPHALFAVLHHFNRDEAHAITADERLALAGLNRDAATAALRAGGFEAASRYVSAGLSLLDGAEGSTAELELALMVAGAEASLGAGDGDGVHRYVAAVRERGSPLQAARAAEVLIDLHTGRAEAMAALQVAREALAGLGVDMPVKVGKTRVANALLRTWWQLRSFDDERAEALPAIEDVKVAQALHLMLLCTTPAYLADHDLWAWLATEMARRGVRAGASHATAWGVMNYGIIVASGLGALEYGYRLATTGRRLFERGDTFGLRARGLSAWHVTMHHVRRPLRETLLPLKSGLKIGREEGDPLHAGIDSLFYVGHLLFTGQPLAFVAEEAERLVPECEALGVPLAVSLLSAIVDLTEVLRGERPLDEWLASDPAAGPAVSPTDRSYFEMTGRLLRLMAAVVAQHDEAALKQVALAKPVRQSANGTINGLMFTYNESVAAGRLAAAGDRHRSRQLRRGLKEMGKRAALNATDYAPKVALLEALDAASRGRNSDAMRAFSRAQDAADEVGAHHDILLIADARTAWLERMGASRETEVSRKQVEQALWTWGVGLRLAGVSPPPTASHTLDVEVVARAQDVLAAAGSREAVLCELLRLAGVRAGAESGALMVLDGERLHQLAGLSVAGVAMAEAGPAAGIAMSAVRYVARTGEVLVHADARRSGAFSQDPHVIATGVRSLLCVPLTTRGERRMALYLEHNELPGVFTPERVEVVRVLATMAGAMAENAWLVTKLQDRAERLRDANTQLQHHSRGLEKAVAGRTRELTELHGRQASILDSLAEGVLLVDESMLVTYANRAAAALLRRSREVLLGAPVPGELLAGDTADGVSSWEVELELGKELCSLECSRQKQAGGRGEVLSFRDVTHSRELETRLLQVQKMDAIGQFVGGVAHEFNNLLTPILGNVELAQTSPDLPQMVAELLHEVHRASQRAVALVSQLLAFGRRTPTVTRGTDVVEVTGEVLRFSRHSIDRAIRIHWTQPQGDLIALVDPNQLHQVLLNLMLNARDAVTTAPAQESPCIEVAVAAATLPAHGDARWVRITVADNGPGMSPEVKRRAFEPFFTTKPQGQGTGLGLSVVMGIIERHGGVVDLSSELGRGTALSFYLPAVERPDPPAIVTRPPQPALTTKCVLVVDDEPQIRRLAKQVLTRANYEVSDAPDGQSALAAVRADRPDLVLLDLSMPGLDGWGVLEALQQEWPDLPVIIWSGYHHRDSQETACAAGAVRMLRKPFKVLELLEAVSDALGTLSSKSSS